MEAGETLLIVGAVGVVALVVLKRASSPAAPTVPAPTGAPSTNPLLTAETAISAATGLPLTTIGRTYQAAPPVVKSTFQTNIYGTGTANAPVGAPIALIGAGQSFIDRPSKATAVSTAKTYINTVVPYAPVATSTVSFVKKPTVAGAKNVAVATVKLVGGAPVAIATGAVSVGKKLIHLL